MTHTLDLALLAPLLVLGGWIAVEDIRTTWISLHAVLAFAGLALLRGLAPWQDDAWQGALCGAALAAGLGCATRAYARWRTGAAAFGFADIALMTGIGAMLGPRLVGPFVIASVILAIGLAFALPRILGRREEEIEGGRFSIIPLCPALLGTWLLLDFLRLAALLPTDPLN